MSEKKNLSSVFGVFSKPVKFDEIKRVALGSLIDSPLDPLFEFLPVIITENGIDAAIILDFNSYEELEIARGIHSDNNESLADDGSILFSQLQTCFPEALYPFLLANVTPEEDRVIYSPAPLLIDMLDGREFVLTGISHYLALSAIQEDEPTLPTKTQREEFAQQIKDLHEEEELISWLQYLPGDAREVVTSNYWFADEPTQELLNEAFEYILEDYVLSDPPADEDEESALRTTEFNLGCLMQIFDLEFIAEALHIVAAKKSFGSLQDDVKDFLAEWMPHFRVGMPTAYWLEMMNVSPLYWDMIFDGLTIACPEKAVGLLNSLEGDEAELFIQGRFPIFLNTVREEHGFSNYLTIIDRVVKTFPVMPAHLKNAICDHFQEHRLLPQSDRPAAKNTAANPHPDI